jgi:hypothetical protein
MPNWCDNEVNLAFPNNELLELFLRAVSNESIFSTFAPLNLGSNDNGEPIWEFSKAIEIWGTKCEPLDIRVLHRNQLHLQLSFDTAWAPPIGVYERMNKNRGISVVSYFSEPGEEVFGKCTYSGDIEENTYYNYPHNKLQLDNIRSGLDSGLDKYMKNEWIRIEKRWEDRNSEDSF